MQLLCPDAMPRALLVYICSAEHSDAEALAAALGDCALAVFPVRDWNEELSPWAAEGFPGGGRKTLERLLAELSLLPADIPRYIGGYSLAGLFALWAFHESGAFHGCAAVSGSFWYPGLVEYVQSAPLSPESRVYLSLGRQEHKSRNRQMRSVKTALNTLYDYYSPLCHCKLEWNEGNHFTDPTERMRKGFAWLLES